VFLVGPQTWHHANSSNAATFFGLPHCPRQDVHGPITDSMVAGEMMPREAPQARLSLDRPRLSACPFCECPATAEVVIFADTVVGKGRLLGRFFATTQAKLREISERLGLRHVVNLAGCSAR
jgi:hypothetical protein